MKHLLMSEICTMRKGQTINEKDIYSLKGSTKELSIPVISSSTENNGVMGYIDKRYIEKYKTVGKKGDLSWATNGYAGKVFLRDDFFLPTEKCGIASIKQQYKNEINPKWLEIYLNSITSKYVVAKEGNGKLEIVQMKNIPIEIPDIVIQENIILEYQKNQKYISQLKFIKEKLELEKNKLVSFKSKKITLNELFYITSGIRITLENVYQNSGDFPILTSKTKGNGISWYASKKWLESFSKNDRPVIVDVPCITWAKDGNAGKLFYRDFLFYPNDHCGVMIPKQENINMKWFILCYQDEVYKAVVAKDGQGMLYEEQMANIEIELPVGVNGEVDIDLQNEIYKEYQKLYSLLDKINLLIEKYSI